MIMNTIDFKTKTTFLERCNASVRGYWTVALDIGYSAIKGISPNRVYSFPSFARKIENGEIMSSFGVASDTDIQYRDETGAVWDVGALAIDMTKKDDTRENSQSLYGRNRYFSPMFKVIARVGIALGLIPNEFGTPKDRKLVIQTGLPPAYLKSDSQYIREVLSGTHKFEIKLGKEKWKTVEFELTEKDIKIMAQPMGSLFSASLNNDCNNVPDGNDYFESGTLVLDGGFGTLDMFAMRHRHIESSDTHDNLGMKAVFQRTADEIFDKYGVEIPVHIMQQYLKEGTVSKFNRAEMKTEKIDFSATLEKHNREVCMEAIEKVKSIYNNLLDYKYLLVAGGTGAAWYNIIKQHFAGMVDLKVINCWDNDTIPPIFSNVRGYYLFCVGLLRAQNRSGE